MNKIILALALCSISVAQAIVPVNRSELSFPEQGSIVQEVINTDENLRTMNRGLTGRWSLGGDTAAGSIILTITDTQPGNGYSIFSYDVSLDGYANDSGLIGIKKGNLLYFTVAYLMGHSVFVARLSESGDKASYAEIFVNDRYCEYTGTGSIFTCEFYVSEIADVSSGSMNK